MKPIEKKMLTAAKTPATPIVAVAMVPIVDVAVPRFLTVSEFTV